MHSNTCEPAVVDSPREVTSPSGERQISDALSSDVASKQCTESLKRTGQDSQEELSIAHVQKKQKRVEQTAPTPSKLPPINRYVPVAIGGSCWRDHDTFETVVVMGDSYSSPGGKTWVSHMNTRLSRENKAPQIQNLATPGATAERDLPEQMTRFLALNPGRSPDDRSITQRDPDRTTFFLFFGINDCGESDVDDLEAIVETVFEAVHDLYVKANARNFVLVDVPPIDRSPQAVDSGSSDEIAERVTTWNDSLKTQATDFGNSYEEATIMLFSSHQVLTEVLEDPTEFDLSEDDPDTEGGGFWEDDLHLAPDIHDILAERLLSSVILPPV